MAVGPSKTFLDDLLIGDWINEYCPKCGAKLLGNKRGDKWCSFVGCTWGL